MDSGEKIIFSNEIGSVSDKNVLLKKRRQSVPLSQIAYVHFEKKQNKLLGLLFFLIPIIVLIFLFQNGGNFLTGLIALAISEIFIAIGWASFSGRYHLTIFTNGIKVNPLILKKSKMQDGKALSDAIMLQVSSK